MKELPYNGYLEKDIEKSKQKGTFWKDYLTFLGLGLTLSLIGIGFYNLIHMNLLNLGIIAGGVSLGGAVGIGVHTYKTNKKGTAAREALTSLTRELKKDGVNLSIGNIQKALVTQDKKEIIETNRKSEKTSAEQIIERYYTLDEEDQIKVLQQTLNTYKNANGEITHAVNLELMEEEDLKNIELPTVVDISRKSLKFNDSKK